LYNYGKRRKLKNEITILINKAWLIEEQFDNQDVDIELLTKDFRKDINHFIKKYHDRLENLNLITSDLNDEIPFRKLFVVAQKLQYFVNDGIIRFKKKDIFIIRFFKKFFIERKFPQHVL
jgi:uncharacterized protein YlaN (UPF0358 family)